VVVIVPPAGFGSCTRARLPAPSVVKVFQLPKASVTVVLLPAY
jgi:hypothetical protein